jgi:L-lactate dehydrogenase (cytochrome)
MASTRQWFETVAEAQRRAQRRLPPSVYLAIVGGTEQGLTLADNVHSFDELRFRPRIADIPRERSQATRVLGQDIRTPVVISPTGVQAVHPDGEVAVARAAAAAGTLAGLSSFASRPMEEVVAANPATFFQLYWIGTRDQIAARVERARAAGAVALALTLDWSFATRRDWGAPSILDQLNLATMLRFAPQCLTRPRWLARYARARALPDLTVPNMALPGQPPPRFFGVYGDWMATPAPSWDDISWLRELWGGPFMIKGVVHPDDARRAIDAGASAISVSNHGGSNLDGAPGAVRLLPDVIDAVHGQIEVLQDGGIRRGGDVVKALALGATAVMIGRAYLFGLACAGEHGVTNTLTVLRDGIDETLRALARARTADLSREDLIVPDTFIPAAHRHLG